MALVLCKECEREISDQAATCPYCGYAAATAGVAAAAVADPAPTSVSRKTALFALFGFILIGFIYYEQTLKPARLEAEAIEAVQCAADLRCFAEKHRRDASARCERPVERLAINNFEWFSGATKFSHFRWKDQANEVVTYAGDKIRFQNGFGAWIIHTYECDYSVRTNTVLDVRAQPGQL